MMNKPGEHKLYTRDEVSVGMGSAEAGARYAAVRAATAALAEGLSAEDCTLQSMPDASPVKWHLAHTTWFFETFVLAQALPQYAAFDAAYRVLFNSYYVTVGRRHPRAERGLLSRPGLREVWGYRAHVDRVMRELMEGWEQLPPRIRELIELGLHHEQQHQELILTDLLHLFSRNPLRPAYRPSSASAPVSTSSSTTRPALRLAPSATAGHMAAAPGWINHAAGQYELGHQGDSFAFDNESPRHRVYVGAYALASRPVTNGDYLAFIEDGGYARPELWLSEGWDQVSAHGWQAPLYWEQGEGGWCEYGLQGLQALERDAPLCHASFYEADAYARWAGARLPTEAEWEIAAADCDVAGNFVEDGALRPLPAAPGNELRQMYGDVWEWTSSSYAPYPGYQPAPGAVGEYNGKFMVNQYVLRGGSFATPHSHVRASYRNFFPAAARWQFSGLRLAKSL